MRDYLYSVITDRAKGIKADILRGLLFLASQIYSLLIRAQNLTYKYKLLKPAAVDVAVISIGNITWGGTGKTSMVLLLADYLSGQGRKVAVLSRGYGKNQKFLPARQAVKTKNQELEAYKLIGDEPYLLGEKNPNVPVLVGRDRIKNAEKAVREFNCDTILLDDGFQHRRIERDLDILLIDVLDAFGNGYLLPRGSLREPAANIGRADVIVLTNYATDERKAPGLLSQVKAINDKIPVFHASYRFKRLYDILTKENRKPDLYIDKPISIMAGIGNFASFRESVKSALRPNISCEFNFPDHHDYTREDLRGVWQSCCDKGVNLIITTEKDAIRIRPHLSSLPDIKLLVLEVSLEISDNSKEFFRIIDNVFTN